MAWELKAHDWSEEEILELVIRHRLMPSNPVEAASACCALNGSDQYVLMDGDVEVGKVFLNIDESKVSGSLDLIPVPKYFRAESDYSEEFRAAMADALREAFANSGFRRMTAFVPDSRGRTKKALRSLGFKLEGRISEGILFRRKDEPEDLYVLGLCSRDFAKEYGDGT